MPTPGKPTSARAAASAPAVAAPPQHETVIIPDEGTDPAGTTCAFPVHFSQVERREVRVFTDGDGNFVKALVHIDYDATIGANGKTSQVSRLR